MLWHGNHHVSTMQIIRGAVELIEKPNIKPTILITGTRKIRFPSVQHHGSVGFGSVWFCVGKMYSTMYNLF